MRVHADALAEADRIAALSGMSAPDVLRAAISAGLPIVEKRAKEPKA